MSSKPKVMIVEDDPLTLEALKRVLTSDFHILTASRPSEALELFKQNKDIAVLLSDYSLPEMSGAEFLKKSQQISPQTVRAVITGYHDLEHLTKDLTEQAVHRFLMKPWDNLILKHQIHECVQYHNTLNEKAGLLELSITDPKTGLYNSRFMMERLREEIDRAKRHNRPLSLVLIDLDYFKQVNDEKGHIAGDQLLIHFANKLKGALRTIDICARYGGDEFALILPDTDSQQALLISERIRKQSHQEGLSISLGISQLNEKIKDSHDFVELTDRALYQAKNQGRNQSVIAH